MYPPTSKLFEDNLTVDVMLVELVGFLVRSHTTNQKERVNVLENFSENTQSWRWALLKVPVAVVPRFMLKAALTLKDRVWI